MRLENRSITPTLAEVIQTAIDANLVDLHVCLPAKIITYDSSTQTATLLPSLLIQYEDDTVLPWAPIPNVPIVIPKAAAGKAYIHVPLIPGDDVTMLICERSLDNWKTTGMLSDPEDRRQFDITDAFAFPGGSAGPFVSTINDPMSIEIGNFLSNFQISPTGQYSIKGGLNDELIGWLSDLITQIAASFTATALGPQPLINPTDPGFTQLITRIAGFKKGGA